MFGKKWQSLLALLIVSSLILAACGEEEPEVVEKEVTRVVKETVVETVVEKETVVETVVEKETVLQTVVEKETVVETVVEEVVITATPEPAPEGPTVGGKLVIASVGGYDTLDPPATALGQSLDVIALVGATLMAWDPNGELVPYLAESYEVSEDGLTWDIKIREGVKFHDGTPLTAEEYAWTFNRMWDPEATFVQGTTCKGKCRAEAVDDYTLRLQLDEFNPDLLPGLAHYSSVPLSPAWVEAAGDQISRKPMSVGPYIFKEWITGEKIILERNPDYAWAPAFLHQGPPYIETIEIRELPEPATIVAGMEAGEVDQAGVRTQDLIRIQDTGMFQILDYLGQGMWPALHMNVGESPFDDIRVRKALNLAVDRETLIKVVLDGYGAPQYGPLSPTIPGYWPGVEEIGYGYDLEQAKALMEEAGYTYNADGMLEKDGEPVKFTLGSDPFYTRLTEVVQAQYKELGIEIEIELLELGLLFGEVREGNYDLAVMGYVVSSPGILYTWFHSSRDAAINPAHLSDPELDEMLTMYRQTVDPVERQEWLDAAQERIVAEAYVIPLYVPKNFIGLSNRVKGGVLSPTYGDVYLMDAYIEGE